MPEFPNPKLAGINDVLTQLELLLEEVGRAHSFRLIRGRESYRYLHRYVPEDRYLHRDVPGGILHEIGLIISIPMTERLERGFFPEIPCTFYAAAFHRGARKRYLAEILRDQPFNSLRASLPSHLRDAVAKLDSCTPDSLSEYGTPDRNYPA